jgi:threonine dehydrogenase-like Zn-dependent dehydrogenase
MNLIQHGRLDPTVLATHRFGLGDTMSAYDTFADSAATGALKVVLNGSPATTPEPDNEAPVVAVG